MLVADKRERVVVALLRAQTKPRRNATRRNRPQSWSKQLSRLRRGIGVRMSVGVGMDVDVDVEHDFQGCGKVPLLTAKSMQCKSSAAAKSHLLWSEKPKTSPSWWWSCDAPQPPLSSIVGLSHPLGATTCRSADPMPASTNR